MTSSNSASDPGAQAAQRRDDAIQTYNADAGALLREQETAALQGRPQPTRTLPPLAQVVDADGKGTGC